MDSSQSTKSRPIPSYEALVQQVLALTEQLSKADTQRVRIEEPKVSHPEYYFGDRGNCRVFLLQVSIVVNAQPSRYASDASKIAYTTSWLRGEAFKWFSPFLERRVQVRDADGVACTGIVDDDA